jgi:hypothetical protein
MIQCHTPMSDTKAVGTHSAARAPENENGRATWSIICVNMSAGGRMSVGSTNRGSMCGGTEDEAAGQEERF